MKTGDKRACETSIQSLQDVALNLDSRLRGNDTIIYGTFFSQSLFQLFTKGSKKYRIAYIHENAVIPQGG